MTTGPISSELATILSTDVPEDSVEGMIGLQLHSFAQGVVGVVTLNRPRQHNALSLAGWTGLVAAFARLAADNRVRAVVLRGAGGRAFSAGADISEFPERRLDPEAADVYNREIAKALRAVQELPCPVVAMVDGLAIGGGCELAAACDIRIAAAGSRFGIPIGRLGVTLGVTETRAVGAALGRSNLMYLVSSGRIVDTAQVAAWGFVQQVVERDQLASEVASLLVNILASSEVTIRSTKVTAYLADDPATTDEHPALRSFHGEAYGGPDLKEGVAAFLEARAPSFTEERKADHGRASRTEGR
jgi:enoyl-CoA hydratase